MSIYSTSHNLTIFEDHNTSLFKIYSLIPSNTKTILDVGCSSGYLGEYIKLHSKKVIQIDGIEIDKHDRKLAIKHLNHIYNIDIQKSTQISKIHQKYDVIIFADVLEHTINPKLVLSNFKDLLNPHGTILISVPNITHQSIILEQLSGQWNYEESGLLDITHLHFFDYNGIVSTIEDNKLYITKIDYSIFNLPQQKIKAILENEELIKILKRPQHKIFQFIVSASNNKPIRYKSFINNQEVLKPVSDWISEWELMWKDIPVKKETETLKNYKNKIKKLKRELNVIKNSKLYKLWPIYNKLKFIVK